MQPVIDLKKNTNLQVCFRKNLNFLKYKISLTRSISNRLVNRSNYYCSYKNLKEYYTFLLRANFCNVTNKNYIPYLFSEINNKRFLAVYFQKESVKNFDFLLYWRGCQFNSLFNVKTATIKKRKSVSHKYVVYFIKPDRRILFVWKWLKTFHKSLYIKDVKKKYLLIKTFENFLMVPDQSSIINDFKLQIYKLKLLRVT